MAITFICSSLSIISIVFVIFTLEKAFIFANLISMSSRSFRRRYSGTISSFFFFAFYVSRFTVFHVSHFTVGSLFLLCDFHRQRRQRFKERRLQKWAHHVILSTMITTLASAIRYRSIVAIYMLLTIVIFHNMRSVNKLL